MKPLKSHRFSFLSLFLILTLASQPILAQNVKDDWNEARIFTQSPAALAQDAQEQSDWAAVQAIEKGKKLAIETKNGERIEGKLSNASDTGLELIRKNKAVSVNRTDIRRIYRLSGGSRVKAVLIGAGIGAGVGAGAGAGFLGATGGSDSAGDYMVGITLIVAGIGAAIGAVAGGRSKRTLIYETR